MDVTLPDGTTINNVPEGMSKAELVGKLKANGHDTSWYKEETPVTKQTEPAFFDKAKEAGKNALGGLEAAGAMASGLPAMIASGIEGIVRTPFQGIDKATEEMQKTQEYRYHPRSDAGKTAEEAFGFAMNKAGELGEPIIRSMRKPFTDPDKIASSPADLAISNALVQLGTMDLPLHVISPKGVLSKFAKGEKAPTLAPELLKQAEEVRATKPVSTTGTVIDRSTGKRVPSDYMQNRPASEGLPADVEVPNYQRGPAAQAADLQNLKEITKPIDEQQVVSPYDLQETPPELAALNKEPVRDKSTGQMISPDQAMPELEGTGPVTPTPKPVQGYGRFQRGMVDPSVIPDFAKKVAEAVKFGLSREYAIKTIKEDFINNNPEYKNNASGQTDASLEAINRLDAENAAGQNRVRVKANGEVIPLIGAERVDARAYPGEVILQKGVGRDPWTVLDGDGNVTAARIKANQWDQSRPIRSPGNKQGGAFTPFSSTKSPIAKFKNFTEFKKAMDDAGQGDVALDVWKKNGGKVRTADLSPEATEFANYAKNFGKNKDDAYEANRDLIKQSSDTAPNMFGRNYSPGGASAKRFLDNPAATWAINVIDGAKKRGNMQAEAAIDKVGQLTKGMTTLFGSSKELHNEINSFVKGDAPKTEAGTKLHEGLKKMFDEVYDPLNEAYKQKQIDAGTLPENVKTLPKLDNYFPHMWEGPFGFKVTDPTTGRVLTVVRERSAKSAEKARKYIEQQLAEKGLGGQFDLGNTEYNKLLDSSKFQQDVGLVSQQFMEALDLMGDAQDPVVQNKLSILDRAMRKEAWNSASGFKKHTENRIGVTGFKGDKPWESEAQNAKDAIEVTHKYFRDANNFIESQKANRELRKFYEDNPDKPNTIGYAEHAYQQAFVGLENKLGPIMGKLQDAYSNSTGWAAGDVKNALRGVKSVVTAATLTSTRNAIAQILQAPVSIIPELVRMKNMEGGPQAVGKSLITGLVQTVLYPTNKAIEVVSGKPNVISTPKTREITKYMIDNGITDTYAMDAAYHHSPSPLKKGLDTVQGAGLRLPDQIGRVWTFTSFVKSFEEAGYSLKESMDKASDLTDVVMNSGAKHLQAPMFQKAGVVGEMAGNVQSFSHNALTQIAYDIKSAKKGDPGAKSALATKLGLQIATAGAVGMYGVQEADKLWDYIKELSGNPDIINTPGIKETIYTMLPPELSVGPLSTSTGVDFSGTFAAPQVASDNFMSMVWPLGGRAVDIGAGLLQAGKGFATGNKYQQIAGTAKAAPDLPYVKGPLEKKMSVQNADGTISVENPNGKNRLPITRTPEQQAKRNLGLTDLGESLDRKFGYELYKDETLRKGAQKDIVDKIPEVFAENTINRQLGVEWKSRLKDLQTKYLELGGDPDKFVSAAIHAAEGRASRSQMISMLRVNAKDMESLQKNKRILDKFNKLKD